jgi:hypothetical protein
MRRGDGIRKEERKARPEVSGGQEPSGTAGEKRVAISENTTKLVQTKLKKNNLTSYHKTRYDPKLTTVSLSANINVCCRHL